MAWFRWYEGAATDPKFHLISRKSGQPVAYVVAVWAMLLERASAAENRGSIAGFDCESVDAVLGMPDGTAEAIVQAMENKGLLAALRVADWQKYRASDVCRTLDVSSKEWERLRSAVFERDNYTCQYCGKRDVALECDHILPFSRGGNSTIDNLITACKSCNRSKGAKTLSEWMGCM